MRMLLAIIALLCSQHAVLVSATAAGVAFADCSDAALGVHSLQTPSNGLEESSEVAAEVVLEGRVRSLPGAYGHRAFFLQVRETQSDT